MKIYGPVSAGQVNILAPVQIQWRLGLTQHRSSHGPCLRHAINAPGRASGPGNHSQSRWDEKVDPRSRMALSYR
jgi:hypothetical protein